MFLIGFAVICCIIFVLLLILTNEWNVYIWTGTGWPLDLWRQAATHIDMTYYRNDLTLLLFSADSEIMYCSHKSSCNCRWRITVKTRLTAASLRVNITRAQHKKPILALIDLHSQQRQMFFINCHNNKQQWQYLRLLYDVKSVQFGTFVHKIAQQCWKKHISATIDRTHFSICGLQFFTSSWFNGKL